MKKEKEDEETSEANTTNTEEQELLQAKPVAKRATTDTEVRKATEGK